MQDFRIAEETEDQERAEKEILKQLLAFNARQAGPLDHRKIVLTVRGHDDAIVGGLVGAHYWNCTFVDLLWLHDDCRGKGVGTTLMRRVEADAKGHGSEVLFLSTFSFQAPGFYEKLGYAAFGALEGVPKGGRRIWYSKRI